MSNDPIVADPSAADSSGAFRFRLVHLFYVIAVVASSLATFGAGGIVTAIVIVGFWSVVFAASSRPRALGTGCLILIVACCLLMCLLPSVQTAREAARRVQCRNNLTQISLALHNYHDVNGCLPPACVADKDGTPMHSWRVLLLPYIEERALYDQYDFSEPWDGPNNRELLSKMPYVYACPSRPRRRPTVQGRFTSYVAVLDPRTAWPGATPAKLADFVDGTSNTVMVVEYGGHQIPWMQPLDPGLAEFLETIDSTDLSATGAHRSEDFFYIYYDGRNVALADGSMSFVVGASPERWSELLIIDDKGTWSDGASARIPRSAPVRRPKLDNWFRLGLFILITLFPLPWVWIHPGPRRETRTAGEPS